MPDARQVFESTPYVAALGAELDSLDGESGVIRLPYSDENSNPGKALHGGVAASLINLGGLTLAESVLGEDAGPFHTCSMHISYLAAAIGETVIAEATLLRRGKELCFVETAVRTEEGKPIARGISTVRGRFKNDVGTPVITPGDNGDSDPGPMGPFLPETVPFIGKLGLSIQHMAGGHTRIAMPFKETNTRADGGIHEGPVLALADTTGAMAAWAETGPGAYKASTVGVQAQMVAPAAGEDLVAYGKLLQRDREIFWCDVQVAATSTMNTIARATVLYRIVT